MAKVKRRRKPRQQPVAGDLIDSPDQSVVEKVRVFTPASEDTPRISRKRRARKRALSPKKKSERQERALKKEHPHAKLKHSRKKRIRVRPPRPKLPWDLSKDQQHLFNLSRARVTDFLRRTQKRRKNLARDLRNEYKEIFGTKAPKGVPILLLRMAMAYELQVRGFAAAGLPLPESVKQNWEAAKQFKLASFDEGMRSVLEVQLKYGDDAVLTEKKGMTEMAKKGKSKRKKGKGKGKDTSGLTPFKGFKGTSSGLGVAAFLVKMLKLNHKKKLTDEQLAKKMNKEFPQGRTYDVEYVRSMRSLFNRGGLAPQGGMAPKRELPPFNSDGEQLPKNYRSDAEEAAPAKKKKGKKKGAKKKGTRKGMKKKGKKLKKAA